MTESEGVTGGWELWRRAELVLRSRSAGTTALRWLLVRNPRSDQPCSAFVLASGVRFSQWFGVRRTFSEARLYGGEVTL